MYRSFDPPVNEFSTRTRSGRGIRELEDLREQPDYEDTAARRERAHALAQARELLEASLDLQARLVAGRRVSGDRA